MPDRAHIDEVEEQALLYALGALGGPEAEQFRQRLDAGCSLCRGLLSGYEQVTTALAIGVPEVAAPPERIKSRLLERIGATEAPAPRKRRPRPMLIRDGQTPWVETGNPGVQMRELRGQSTLLLRLAPESWFPAHDHTEAEECLVLDGSIESEGITANAGDYIYMPKGSHHAPLFSKSGCTLLIAYTS